MGVAFAVDRADKVQPPPVLGCYRLLGRIAEGGMASIFRGQDLGSGDVVALKTVRIGAPHEIASLSSEIEVLRSLRHPGIVRFVSSGTWNDLPWMATELLEGKTLFEEIRSMWRAIRPDLPRSGILRSVVRRATTCCSGGNASEIATGASTSEAPVNETSWLWRLDADPALETPTRPAAAGRLHEVVSLVAHLAVVLDHLHRQGVVHCDVKPENVVLGYDERATLLDFGLASRLRNRRAEVDENPLYMGTVEYAAPERLYGGRVDASTDTYSLGCVLYELVTGRLVFGGVSAGEIAQKHLDDEPVAPSELVSGVPWQLEDLILEMLAKHPSDRPRGVIGILDEVKQSIRRAG